MTWRSAGPSSIVSVNVHVYDTAVYQARVYPREGRITVTVAGSGGEVTVYCDRGNLVRLQEVLADSLDELDETGVGEPVGIDGAVVVTG